MSSTASAPDAVGARSPLARISSWFKERVGSENDESLAGGVLRAWQRELDACAREQGGPVAARARARELIDLYLAMNAATRLEALKVFATRLGPNPEEIAAAAARHARVLDSAEQWQAELTLRAALASPRARVIRQFGAAPDGVRFLVDLRADLLGRLEEAPELAVLEDELALQLGDWFDVGFLELKRLSWESPAHVLEKLMQYEAVHEIRSWADMKNRLDHDRRVYAFFHPRLKDEPLVFVEVALTETIAGNVQAILDEGAPLFDPRRARAAMFYSISSTQEGLRGISFGNFLIKRVVEDLQRDFPRLLQFSTLSPMPGFSRWLSTIDGVPAALRDALGRPDWTDDAKLCAEMRAPLMSLAAQYLLEAKRGTGRDAALAQPLDAVARFHLGNGARAERLQWLADRSPRGLSQSHGLMVNYLYDLDEIEANVTCLSTAGEVAAGPRMQRLAQIGARMRSETIGSTG
ncbi:MAG: malonyl-CoA decarboxylase domain-containing protein [Burkholderiales bacterium]